MIWSRRHTSPGFSLIEMLVVIIVVGILASVAMQSMTSTVQDVRRLRTEREMDMLADAIVGDPGQTQNNRRSDFGYVGDVGAFPPNLQALAQNPGGLATWAGPYLPPTYSQDATGFRMDDWGTAYAYSGGTVISSTGSGSTISKKVADAQSDYLSNRITGTILDAEGNPPGPTYADSVDIVVTFPDGAGSTASKTYQPNIAGVFTLDTIPAGHRQLRVIYTPNVDTLVRRLTVLPRHKSGPAYQFAAAYFGGGGGGGGGGTSGMVTLRPDGVGSSSQLSDQGCSSNWQCVDESVADDDGTYVRGPNFISWRLDLYAAEDNTSGAGTIDSVVIYIRCRQGHSSSRVRTALRTNGTTYNGSQMNPPGSYTDYSTTYATNPQTSSAWTWSEIDAMEIGVRIRRNARCTQVWAEVYYTD